MWGKILTTLLIGGLLIAREGGPAFYIVQSDDIGPYNKAVTSFKVSCGGESPVFNLKGNRGDVDKAVSHIRETSPSVLVTVGKLATIALAQKVKDIPLVFGLVLNPPEELVKSGRVAGVSLTIPVGRQLETLLDIIPNVKAVGTLYNPKKSRNEIKELFRIARERGVKVVASRIDEPDDAPRAIRALVGEMDAFLLLPDPTVANKKVFFQLLTFVAQKKIPLWTPSRAFVEAGALVSLAPSYEGIGEQLCRIAKKVAQGTPLSEIGVQSPDVFELTFNLKTAEQLNLNTLPLAAAKYCVKARCKINVF